MLGHAIPEVERAVGASGAEGAVLWVEGDSVDGKDVRHVVLRGVAVALEREVHARKAALEDGSNDLGEISIPGVLFFYVLDSASPFDTPNCEAH